MRKYNLTPINEINQIHHSICDKAAFVYTKAVINADIFLEFISNTLTFNSDSRLLFTHSGFYQRIPVGNLQVYRKPEVSQ